MTFCTLTFKIMKKSKIYFLRLAAFTLITILLIVSVNIHIDIYGLYKNSEGKEIKVYSDERISKYLLSFNYIPENFDGILIGPSLSDNLNTEKLTPNLIYNASMMGANISDLKPLVQNVIKNGNIKVLIICLDPYITKDFGKKSSAIDKKQYYSGLGSITLFKAYLYKFIRERQILPTKFDKTYINSFGYYDFDAEFTLEGPEKKIKKMVELGKQEEMHINKDAYNELNTLLNEIRSQNISILGYFSPLPYQIININNEAYTNYQKEILKLFTDSDLILNLNDEKYKNITSDFNTFIDHGHLSKKGQEFVLKELNNALYKLKEG